MYVFMNFVKTQVQPWKRSSETIFLEILLYEIITIRYTYTVIILNK